MQTKLIDRIFFGTALTAALGSCLWFSWIGPAQRRAPRKISERAHRVEAAAVRAELSVEELKPWEQPSAQSRGPEWRYDLFTPPEVRYDATTGQFAVTPPAHPADSLDSAAGLELVGVAAEPFRLQLLGYVGGRGKFLGTFENRLTGEVFLAGPGRSLPDLELEVVDFNVRRAPVPLGDGGSSAQWVATAAVRDLHTDETTMLTAGEARYTAELSAVLSAEGEDGKITGRFAPGDEFEASERTYRVERLQLTPAEVELVDTDLKSAHVLHGKPPANESLEGAAEFHP